MVPLSMRIVSGSTKVRFNSRKNHEIYARKWNYDYVYYDKIRQYNSIYDHKFDAFLSLPDDGQWNFWIDDDAFFINMDIPLENFIRPANRDLVFPISPVNPSGGWTFLSSGNFFFRSTPEVRSFFKRARDLDINVVEAWWNENLFGMFTNGDQDRILYLLVTDAYEMDLVPFQWFNTRPYHFSKVNEHLLVHFAVQKMTKEKAIAKFRRRWKYLDDSLVLPCYN
jgi:hypothetical protein